ncbi:hypothetical protein MACH09_12480 [Vibrio sp. MACH09]|nr:hypothetical protein MACH09_12480 [Vibrio sp. MACH09]
MVLNIVGNTMYEFLVGLAVSSNDIYSDYRAATKPILTSYDGGFLAYCNK